MNLFEICNKELKRKSGIYKISYNDHVYIGSSKNLYSRLMEYKRDLLKGRHSNQILTNIVAKYGIENLVVEIVEYCSPEIRFEREKYYIEFYKADINLKDPITFELSESSRAKLGASVKLGRLHGKYKTKYDYSAIERYDIWGNYVTTYTNIEDAEKAILLNRKEITRLAGGYKKGLIRNGIRLRYAVSSVPVQRFDTNVSRVGEHFDFYYIASDGSEQFAFNDGRKVWQFLAKYTLENPLKPLTLIPKLKDSIKRINTNKRRESAKTF